MKACHGLARLWLVTLAYRIVIASVSNSEGLNRINRICVELFYGDGGNRGRNEAGRMSGLPTTWPIVAKKVSLFLQPP